MSQISQIQIKFVATEDRLLLRVSSSAQQEFRFWLTARLVRMLYPALYEALSKTSPSAAQSTPTAKPEVVAFEHERAVAKTDFKTGFKESEQTFPLGDEPILVTKCQLRPAKDGNTILALAPEHGQGIDINLSSDLMHSFTKLLVDAAKIAEWAIDAKPLLNPLDSSGENITIN
ncbi:MAG: hypothetical protein ACU84Q_12680 [Gammaproteobacteria bacterium]